MKDYGSVSIIMPSYNCGRFIQESIESVQGQTYTNWELLIQEDASKDDSVTIIRQLAEKDPRIKLECNEHGSGAAISRNRALKRAKGKWIAFLDSDDVWFPEKLEHQLKFMQTKEYHFSYTSYKEIDENSNETGVKVFGPKHVTKIGMYAFCWPGCLTVMFDREHYGLLQIADIKKNNDYAMWLKVCQKSGCYLLNECLAKYRRGRKGSISTHGYITMMKWHYKLWHDAMEMNSFVSLFWTIINMVCGIYKKIFYVKRYNQ